MWFYQCAVVSFEMIHRRTVLMCLCLDIERRLDPVCMFSKCKGRHGHINEAADKNHSDAILLMITLRWISLRLIKVHVHIVLIGPTAEWMLLSFHKFGTLTQKADLVSCHLWRWCVPRELAFLISHLMAFLWETCFNWLHLFCGVKQREQAITWNNAKK